MEKKVYFTMGKKKIVIVSLTAIVALYAILISTLYFVPILTSKLPIADTKKLIETNFFNFNEQAFGIFGRKERVLIATNQIEQSSRDGEMIFALSRSSRQLKVFRWNKSIGELKLKSQYDYKEIGLEAGIENGYEGQYIFDIAFDSNSLYLSRVTFPLASSGCDNFEVLKLHWSTARQKLSPANRLFKSEECIHVLDPLTYGWHDFAGRMAFNSTSVFMTAGFVISDVYGGVYPNPKIQGISPNLKEELKKQHLFGSIISIDKVSGSFQEVAKGLRSPAGVAVNPKNPRTIWVSDHGPRGGDELNLIEQGKNYGWPWVTLGAPYLANQLGDPQLINTRFFSHKGYESPRFYWTPSIGPSQLAFLANDLSEKSDWKSGDLLMGSLKANSLFHFKIANNYLVESVEQIQLSFRIRDLEILGKAIILSTDDGRLVILDESTVPISTGAFPPVDILSPIYKAPGTNWSLQHLNGFVFRVKAIIHNLVNL